MTVSLVQLQQGAGDAVTDGAGLAGDAAAGDGSLDVNLANQSVWSEMARYIMDDYAIYVVEDPYYP